MQCIRFTLNAQKIQQKNARKIRARPAWESATLSMGSGRRPHVYAGRARALSINPKNSPHRKINFFVGKLTKRWWQKFFISLRATTVQNLSSIRANSAEQWSKWICPKRCSSTFSIFLENMLKNCGTAKYSTLWNPLSCRLIPETTTLQTTAAPDFFLQKRRF